MARSVKPPGVDDDDIAGLCQIHGGVEHQVIPLGDPDGECRAQQLALVANGFDRRIHCRDAAHIVIDICHRHALEPRHQFRCGPVKVLYDPASDRHDGILRFQTNS